MNVGMGVVVSLSPKPNELIFNTMF